MFLFLITFPVMGVFSTVSPSILTLITPWRVRNQAVLLSWTGLFCLYHQYQGPSLTLLANIYHFLRSIYPEIVKVGDMHQPFFTGQNFYKAPIFFSTGHLAKIYLTWFYICCQIFYHFLSLFTCLGI